MAKQPPQNIEPSPEEILAMTNALRNATDITCKCGSKLFNQANKLKRISRLVTGEEKDTIVPFPSIFCIKCQEEMILEDEKPNEEGIIQMDFRNKK